MFMEKEVGRYDWNEQGYTMILFANMKCLYNISSCAYQNLYSSVIS